MLMLKDGVVLAGNRYINAMLYAVQTVYTPYGWDVVVTSGRDSHNTGYHPQDRAIDVRFWMVPREARLSVAARIRTLLPAYYDLIVEPDHYHIEADARKEQAWQAAIASPKP